MRKEKGISMISLIVIIVVTILLASMAIGTGTKYMRESKKKSRQTFVSVLSTAVARRSADTSVNSLLYPYLGYYINDSSFFERVFAPKIQEKINFEDGIWYVVDRETATNLGVKEPESYISSIDAPNKGIVTVALVNYITEDVYLLDMSAAEITSLGLTKETVIAEHEHRYAFTEPTCTEPVKCLDCGFILKEALGHSYVSEEGHNETSHYTKVCERCGMFGGMESHQYRFTHFKESGIWYHNRKCTVCGFEPNIERCTIQYSLPSDETEKAQSHKITCITSEPNYSELENHDLRYREISETMHEIYCAVEECGYVIAVKPHVDDNPIDRKCDLCGAQMLDTAYPVLDPVTMINKSASSEAGKYYAKYGDTIEMNISANIPITVPKVVIAGYSVNASNIETTNNRNWKVTYEIKPEYPIADGYITFNIDCTSQNGVKIPNIVTAVTDGKNVMFDGTPPNAGYINKIDRVNEDE